MWRIEANFGDFVDFEIVNNTKHKGYIIYQIRFIIFI